MCQAINAPSCSRELFLKWRYVSKMNVLACVQSKSPSSSAHPFFLLAAAGESKDGASLTLSYPVHTDQKAQVRWKGLYCHNYLCLVCCAAVAQLTPSSPSSYPCPPQKKTHTNTNNNKSPLNKPTNKKYHHQNKNCHKGTMKPIDAHATLWSLDWVGHSHMLNSRFTACKS